jgi:hypothetical protein
VARTKEPLTPSPAGLVILQAKRQLGWTLETMAHRSGVPWRTLYNHETGRRRSMLGGNASRLAKALTKAGVPVTEEQLRGDR